HRADRPVRGPGPTAMAHLPPAPRPAPDDAASRSAPRPPDPPLRWWGRLVLAAVLVLAPVAFLAPSIFSGDAPGAFDLLYEVSPWRDAVPSPGGGEQPIQVDQTEQLPWVDGVWDVIGDGQLPAWTPAVGGGTPVGTTPVFATYSVF